MRTHFLFADSRNSHSIVKVNRSLIILHTRTYCVMCNVIIVNFKVCRNTKLWRVMLGAQTLVVNGVTHPLPVNWYLGPCGRPLCETISDHPARHTYQLPWWAGIRTALQRITEITCKWQRLPSCLYWVVHKPSILLVHIISHEIKLLSKRCG